MVRIICVGAGAEKKLRVIVVGVHPLPHIGRCAAVSRSILHSAGPEIPNGSETLQLPDCISGHGHMQQLLNAS